MRVTILQATPNPIDIISQAAGICYGKSNISQKRVEHCYKSGHMSVFEHASVTFKIEGISRACMAQLTRHRLCSFCAESQRYNRYDLDGNDWYVVPPAFRAIADDSQAAMEAAAIEYQHALDNGLKPEDARYLLPEATKTNLIMTCNVRELFHIWSMRLSSAAQWEIRDLARLMYDELGNYSEQWRSLVALRDGGE